MRLEKGADAAGREAVGFFEDLGKVVGVVEAGLFGGLLYAGLFVLHQQKGALDPFAVHLPMDAHCRHLLVEYLQKMATMRVNLQVHRERVARLHQQVRRITQRVNLFEKVLIPRAKGNIKRIRIGLGEEERSAVVRSKIAKRKN